MIYPSDVRVRLYPANDVRVYPAYDDISIYSAIGDVNVCPAIGDVNV